jgi:hypothetical protein
MNEKLKLRPNVLVLWYASIASILIGAIGLTVMEVERISAEMILAGVFVVGVVTLVLLSIYLLTFHDLKD